MRSTIRGQPYCDYCKQSHPWPRHCRQCGAELQDRRTNYCGGATSPCGIEWGFTHWSWHAVREILLKEKNYTCEECGKVCKKWAPPGSNEVAEVHHVEEVKGDRGPGPQNRRENLLVFCHDHHQLCHHPPQCKLFWFRGRAYPWKDRNRLSRIPTEQMSMF